MERAQYRAILRIVDTSSGKSAARGSGERKRDQRSRKERRRNEREVREREREIRRYPRHSR